MNNHNNVEKIDAFIKDLTDIQAETIEKTVAIADKHDFDRDQAFELLCDTLSITSKIGTLKFYELKKGCTDV